MGVIPVKRRMDNAEIQSPNTRMDNSQLEQETYRAFDEGRAMCVFPEGTSHSESHILHLKDGTSWTLFEYITKQNGKKSLPVVPCGITYINKHRWRSQVLVQ
jgi:1-acyl-sn-glycerol-3-phosphate acyltransferase